MWWCSPAEHRSYIDGLSKAEVRYRRNSLGYEPYKHVAAAQ
jgi:hypothetical protein